jgi:hypothetical protein
MAAAERRIRWWGERIDRGFVCLIAVCAAAAAGCASASSWPQVLVVDEVRSAPSRQSAWIDSYETAVASIADVMTRDLGLPPARAALHFHRDSDAFQAALEASGYDPALARDTARTLGAVGGSGRVLINDASLREAAWVFRVALIAHELTHTLQYDFAGGIRGASDQWLREGFADWVEMRVLVALGFTSEREARRVVLSRVRDEGAGRFPPLAQMATFPDWVRLAGTIEQEALYGYVMLAAELLLDRHGLAAVIEYFRMFGRSDDRFANFRLAFGDDLAAFETAFGAHLARLLR